MRKRGEAAAVDEDSGGQTKLAGLCRREVRSWRKGGVEVEGKRGGIKWRKRGGGRGGDETR